MVVTELWAWCGGQWLRHSLSSGESTLNWGAQRGLFWLGAGGPLAGGAGGLGTGRAHRRNLPVRFLPSAAGLGPDLTQS